MEQDGLLNNLDFVFDDRELYTRCHSRYFRWEAPMMVEAIVRSISIAISLLLARKKLISEHFRYCMAEDRRSTSNGNWSVTSRKSRNHFNRINQGGESEFWRSDLVTDVVTFSARSVAHERERTFWEFLSIQFFHHHLRGWKGPIIYVMTRKWRTISLQFRLETTQVFVTSYIRQKELSKDINFRHDDVH